MNVCECSSPGWLLFHPISAHPPCGVLHVLTDEAPSLSELTLYVTLHPGIWCTSLSVCEHEVHWNEWRCMDSASLPPWLTSAHLERILRGGGGLWWWNTVSQRQEVTGRGWLGHSLLLHLQPAMELMLFNLMQKKNLQREREEVGTLAVPQEWCTTETRQVDGNNSRLEQKVQPEPLWWREQRDGTLLVAVWIRSVLSRPSPGPLLFNTTWLEGRNI